RADPEPPAHVDELGVFRLDGGDRARLERLAADGAIAGLIPDDLRMHRAGPFDLGGRRGRDLRLERHAALRAGSRLVLTDFWIHGADVDRTARGRRGRRGLTRRALEIHARVRLEPAQAALVAEDVGLALEGR